MTKPPASTKDEKRTVKHWASSTLAELTRAPAYPATTHMARHHLCPPAVITDPRAVEINRQIERVKPYLQWLSKEQNTGVDEDSLNASIAFLTSFITGPTSIPMLSVSNDGKATAFLKEYGVSLEAYFDKNKIEYLFTPEDGESHVFGEDDFQSGRIPANLIYLLYANFAKNKPTVAS